MLLDVKYIRLKFRTEWQLQTGNLLFLERLVYLLTLCASSNFKVCSNDRTLAQL
jgi:hypothetical protein